MLAKNEKMCYTYDEQSRVIKRTTVNLSDDTSVGLGQVKPSVAEYLEENGYVPKTSAKECGWDIPIIGFVHGTETMAREKRLEDDEFNIMYVAAYVKSIQDDWIEVYPEITLDAGVLGTLYNQGHDFSTPHANPKPGPFGEKTDYFYELTEEALSEKTNCHYNNHYNIISDSFFPVYKS